MSVEKNTGRSTSQAAAAIVVAGGCRPRARVRWCAIVSTMITAPSTRMPKSMAPIDNRPTGMPVAFISTSANSSEKGMVRTTSRASVGLPRKASSTSSTRPMPVTTLCVTVCRVLSTRNSRS